MMRVMLFICGVVLILLACLMPIVSLWIYDCGPEFLKRDGGFSMTMSTLGFMLTFFGGGAAAISAGIIEST